MRARKLTYLTPLFGTAAIAAGALACFLLSGEVHAASRIKDIVDVEGVRSNQLVGYGIVVGLNGTGDTVRNCPMLMQSMESMMERLQVNIRDGNLNSKNAAAVMVTADLPAFSAPGAKVDVSVSAMCDSKSLLGGTLMVTPLLGADGEAYAVGQGTVQTGSVSAGGASGSSVTKGVPTSGRISSGGTIEHERDFNLNAMPWLRLTLRNPDFTTSKRVANIINASFPGSAVAENPAVVAIKPPAGTRMSDFITQVEPMLVDVDEPAKVVIDEVNGVIVMGENVRLSRVAIAQGNLTIRVDETPDVSQPAPFSQGQTAQIPNSNVKIDEEKGKQLLQLGGGASLSDLVAGLNALKVTPRDMISILQAIKAAGALQAEIQVM
ncbi:MAG: flagellar basal body P-ring protein FlgI [Asticcacaulis sp.]|nr:flagellar basal body P-ring protein FlgI [Asticcacaulis sp.]